MISMRNIVIALIVAFLVIFLSVFVIGRNSGEVELPQTENGNVVDPQNATFVIEGRSVTLSNGIAEQSFEEDDTTKIVTQYFGNSLYTDLTGDGREDLVFLVTQNSGGSGTFFYVVAALNTEVEQVEIDGFLLGDRIDPQTIEVSSDPDQQNVVVVKYADRAPDEPMATEPSVDISVYLTLDQDNHWVMVESDHSGSVGSDSMTLTMKTWDWQRTDYSDGQTTTPAQPDVFTLTFTEDGSVAIGTDCNNVGGQYEVNNDEIRFTGMFMTKMYCEGSQEAEFLSVLEAVTSYEITADGGLLLQQENGEVIAVFR